MGFVKRICGKTPDVDATLLKEFKEFIPMILEKRGFKKVERFLTFEEWLPLTNYTDARKLELTELNNNNQESFVNSCKNRKVNVVKCFIKDENYTDYKYARGIYSRSDLFKCLAGPVFKAIEQVVFDKEYFIKKIPVAERPLYITKLFEGFSGPAYATDYSSFEGSFTPEIIKMVEGTAYSWLCSDCGPEDKEKLRSIMDVIAGTNKLHFKHYSTKVKGTRMSGEMNTSLGNGLTNYLVMEFLTYKRGNDFKGVFEGDDGLCVFANDNVPTSEDYARLGFNIKIDVKPNFNEASFCGIIFTGTTNLTDPMYIISKIGWGDKKYHKSSNNVKNQLLKVKVLSALHQYPGCPIVAPVMSKLLLKLDNVRIRDSIVRKMNWWEKERWFALPNTIPTQTVSEESRLVMERVFNIPIKDQFIIENELLESMDGNNGWMFSQTAINYMPDNWSHYFVNFIVNPPNEQMEKTYDRFRHLTEGVLPELPDWWGV